MLKCLYKAIINVIVVDKGSIRKINDRYIRIALQINSAIIPLTLTTI